MKEINVEPQSHLIKDNLLVKDINISINHGLIYDCFFIKYHSQRKQPPKSISYGIACTQKGRILYFDINNKDFVPQIIYENPNISFHRMN